MPGRLRGALRSLALRIPLLGRIVRERDELRRRLASGHGRWPPGHYYSPLPDFDALRARPESPPEAPPRELPGLRLNEDVQLRLLEEFAGLYADMPFKEEKTPGLRYHFDNIWFRHTDAVVLYCMIRHLRPRRIIEIGSGFSSLVMLDTNEVHFENSISCTCIDPDMGRLVPALKPGDMDRVTVVDRQVQKVDLGIFDDLDGRDILFIDSSHVTKTRSDVNRIVFEVLPRLREGVHVHFHDVFYPFEYPEQWRRDGIAWNEAYLLRALLQFNRAFEIVFFPTFMWRFHGDRLAEAMPACKGDEGGSLWIARTAAPA